MSIFFVIAFCSAVRGLVLYGGLGVISELCDEFRLVSGKPFILAGCGGPYVGYDLLHTMGHYTFVICYMPWGIILLSFVTCHGAL